ncbi:hypothetical protein BO79DRAFT_30763 [Aspergillus costaricaensis CBS 115574]|uniref:Uncharacterized protein n=1 Tax=Aspergillus costaricaensis CBS 115574 TaxID=1448317 RepID=A0ACD1IAZ0_9EURO|nr:hypothetical protein BO79DRAFT_30763 [Aspergillus costaricaensis CBS 115574]RAK87435.1 hypothetical protein BO79DRAFT_30763 [Aspergillus costaricaensis CBS 115574]
MIIWGLLLSTTRWHTCTFFFALVCIVIMINWTGCHFFIAKMTFAFQSKPSSIFYLLVYGRKRITDPF